MNHFKLRYMEYRKKKKTVFLTRDKFVQRLVGNQRTAPGRTEGKPFKSSSSGKLCKVKLSNEVKRLYSFGKV